MYLQFIDQDYIQFSSLPDRIRLSDSSTRTSLHELTVPEQEALGLYAYQDATEAFDPDTHQLTNQLTFDHTARTYVRTIEAISFDTLKASKLQVYLAERSAIRSQGLQTTTGAQLLLKVDEEDLVRWTQLMMKIMAFQAPTEIVWDYSDTKHVLASNQVTPMLAEVSNWFAEFMSDTKEHAGLILAATTQEELDNL